MTDSCSSFIHTASEANDKKQSLQTRSLSLSGFTAYNRSKQQSTNLLRKSKIAAAPHGSHRRAPVRCRPEQPHGLEHTGQHTAIQTGSVGIRKLEFEKVQANRSSTPTTFTRQHPGRPASHACDILLHILSSPPGRRTKEKPRLKTRPHTQTRARARTHSAHTHTRPGALLRHSAQ